jgi:hypothetical protein
MGLTTALLCIPQGKFWSLVPVQCRFFCFFPGEIRSHLLYPLRIQQNTTSGRQVVIVCICWIPPTSFLGGYFIHEVNVCISLIYG